MAVSLDQVKAILIESTYILCENLRPEDDGLLRYLMTVRAITPDHVDLIKHEITNSAKTEKLLDILRRYPVTSYKALLRWLEKEREDLYNEVKKIQDRHCDLPDDSNKSQGESASASTAVRRDKKFRLFTEFGEKGDAEGKFQRADITTPAVDMAHNMSLTNLKFGKILGKGAYGIVSSVTFTFEDESNEFQGYKEAAAKLISKEYIDEAYKMQALKHPNTVRLLGIVDASPTPGDVERCYLIMEKGEMSLYDYLRYRSGSLTRPLQHKWALNICEALKYVHDKDIVHRDIKPRNVIYFQGDIVKLTDFGISEDAIATKTTTAGRGSYPYIAPEANVDDLPRGVKAVFSKASDIYALGLVLWQLFSKEFNSPFPVPPTIHGDFPESLKVMLPKSWETNAHKRPSIEEILLELEKGNSGN